MKQVFVTTYLSTKASHSMLMLSFVLGIVTSFRKHTAPLISGISPYQFRWVRNGLTMALMVLMCFHTVSAQRIIGVGTRFNNSFREWIITTEDEDIRGELRMRWTFQDDWTVWDWRVGEVAATIEQKWTEDPNLWVIRCNGVTVNAKTAWAGEFKRWKLNDGDRQINWESKYANQKEDWEINGSGDSPFTMHTYWEGDPREWVVEDNLPEEVSDAMKVAMIFLTLHFSTPRI